MKKQIKLSACAVVLLGSGVSSVAPAEQIDRPASQLAAAAAGSSGSIGRYEVFTIPFDPKLTLRTGTYTPSGKVLVSYAKDPSQPSRQIMLATQDDDGRSFRPFFSGLVPERAKDNGIRFIIFADNKRIFLGDYILECATSLETCTNPSLLPVTYPAEIADGPHVMHRWSEMVIAPDNRHVSWTTLFNNGTAGVFTGELAKQGGGYVITKTQVVGGMDAFAQDPRHADGVIPQPMRSGEVKQFVHGGTGISVAGGAKRDIADSAVIRLKTGKIETVTNTPGYDETTIFSPDERLGVVMTARFSPKSDLALLGLMPRPYPSNLNMGLNGIAYNYSVSGVRQGRPGNVGPALIEIAPSKMQDGYVGAGLNTDANWVFASPLSWHPSSTKAMWIERERGARRADGIRPPSRMQAVRLLDYRPGRRVPAKVTPDRMPYATSDLAAVKADAAKPRAIDVKVYGNSSGHIDFTRTPQGRIEKTYVNYSDDGQHVYSGRETMLSNMRGNSTYTADVTLTGPQAGTMKLTITFGPATDFYDPTKILFTPDASGKPLSHGYVEYGGQRMNVEDLTP